MSVHMPFCVAERCPQSLRMASVGTPSVVLESHRRRLYSNRYDAAPRVEVTSRRFVKCVSWKPSNAMSNDSKRTPFHVLPRSGGLMTGVGGTHGAVAWAA